MYEELHDTVQIWTITNRYNTNFERYIQATMNKNLLQKIFIQYKRKLYPYNKSLNVNSIDLSMQN